MRFRGLISYITQSLLCNSLATSFRSFQECLVAVTSLVFHCISLSSQLRTKRRDMNLCILTSSFRL
jgi:hypothetical protein